MSGNATYQQVDKPEHGYCLHSILIRVVWQVAGPHLTWRQISMQL